MNEWKLAEFSNNNIIYVFFITKVGNKISELFDRLAMILDEGNGDGETVNMASHTLDGARRISCFEESVAYFLTENFVKWKVDVFTPSDIMRVEEEGLEFTRTYINVIDVGEEKGAERTMKKRAWRKCSVVADTSCGAYEDDGSLFWSEIVTESVMEGVHLFIFF